MKSGHPSDLLPVAQRRPPRLMEQMRARIRYCHYSLSTEKTYLYWTRQFIRFHGLRHPREMGGAEVAAFLTRLANELKASVSTHRQALVARLLYGARPRKVEYLRLRVKGLDFDRGLVIVRQGKGRKDRITMLPCALHAQLRDQLVRALPAAYAP
jgi:site-specific recombinase XerD